VLDNPHVELEGTMKAIARIAMPVSAAAFVCCSVLSAPMPSGASDSLSRITHNAPRATITSFSPTSGAVGVPVKVTGTGFVAPCTATLGGVAAPCTVHSAAEIIVTVPIGAVSGQIKLTTGGSTVTSTLSFKVTLGIWTSIGSGPPTTTFTVAGTGFAPNELVDLYIGTTDEALAVTNAHGDFGYAGFVVPPSTQPGAAWISAAGRHSGLSAQRMFVVRTNWSEEGFGPSGRRVNPYENTLGVSNVGSIGEQWSFTTGNSVLSSPAVANGIVCVGSGDDNVYGINAATGARVWTFVTGANVESSPAVSNGVAYVGSEDGNVYAINVATGSRIWRATVGNLVDSSPAVVNGVVYIGSDAGLFAINASTGAPLRTYATGGGYSSPAVVKGVVYVGSVGGTLYAFNASTGAQLWTYATSGPMLSSPAVVNGVVYIGAYNGNVYAINAASGEPLWTFPTGADVQASPAVADGVVYVSSDDGNVYAINAMTGTQLWKSPTGMAVDSAPAVANGVVYVGSTNGNVYALDAATGADLWTFTQIGGVQSSPAVANGSVYVGSDVGNVYAFNLAGGLAAGQRSERPSVSQLHPDYSLRVGSSQRRDSTRGITVLPLA
jgi:outer membrane protein assembly factor BamB